jgi:serine/threonine protein kinase
MLTGSKPFKDEQGETVFQRIRDIKYVPARQMQSSIPVALDRIIQKCLSKDPEKRYTSVKVMILELEKFLGATRSSHGEDIILQYLDGEALLTPTISYMEIKEGDETQVRFVSWPAVAICVLVAALGLIIGYQWGAHVSPKPATPSTYSAPSAMGKTYPKLSKP